ncbi:MAG: pentapeptide repeat-containing protein [Lachnospiraceae bacterium]|nr:pentapeptide repeat-containing protein [Lachnospiraceae bacterium]
MDAELKLILTSANEKTQYDTYAKNLLSQKCVLACILTAVVDEFKGMTPREAERYIEGKVHIGEVPVDPGVTNVERMTVRQEVHAEDLAVNAGTANTGKANAELVNSGQTNIGQLQSGNRIVGLNTVQQEISEGTVVFDILFYARLRDGLSQIIMNLEAQKDEPSAYYIVNRAVYYGSRQISSQKERDFTGRNFNDLKQVYSVWICMNMEECSWNHIHLTDKPLLGHHHWRGNLNLLNIVLLGIPNEIPQQRADYTLHRLLCALFSIGLNWEERVAILENEYFMDTKTEFGEELKEMCNLSQGILEQGELKKAQETAGKLHSLGWDVGNIAKLLDYRPEQVREWLGIAARN